MTLVYNRTEALVGTKERGEREQTMNKDRRKQKRGHKPQKETKSLSSTYTYESSFYACKTMNKQEMNRVLCSSFDLDFYVPQVSKL